MLSRRGIPKTMIGRRRLHQQPDPDEPNYERVISSIERKGKNTPIQGTSADMIKYALIFVWRRLREEGLDAFPTHTVHDEITIDAAEEDAEKVRMVLEEEMIRAGKKILKKVPIVVDGKVSDVWEH